MGQVSQIGTEDRPFRVVVESARDRSRREHVFRDAFVLVGRHQRADLRLEIPEVSSRQLYLQVLGGRLFGVHLSTHLPTLWDGSPQVQGWVDSGTEIAFGQYRLRFPDFEKTNNSDTGRTANPMSSGSWTGEPMTLELQRGQSASQHVVINRVLTLAGNLPLCKLRINSSRASSIHCSLVRSDRGLTVIDLASRDGVRLNGNKVRAGLIAEGDRLDIGGRVLIGHYQGSSDKAGANDAGGDADDAVSFNPTEIAVTGNRGVSMSSNENPASPLDALVGALSAGQAQNAEQFRTLVAAMMQAFGMMYTEHRRFVQEEMSRIEDLMRMISERPSQDSIQGKANSPDETASPAAIPDLSVPLPPLGNAPSADQIHAWLHERIEEMGEKRSSFWERMAGILRTKAPQNPN